MMKVDQDQISIYDVCASIFRPCMRLETKDALVMRADIDALKDDWLTDNVHDCDRTHMFFIADRSSVHIILGRVRQLAQAEFTRVAEINAYPALRAYRRVDTLNAYI